MRYALSLPNGGECGDPRFLLELAERAEAAGWDALFLEDYSSYQGDPNAPTCDVWTTLGAIAVRTRRMLLGTSVAPLPRGRPWKVAREAAAIDQLSDGRFILGVGMGDAGEHVVGDASLTHFGEELDSRKRAEMLDEALAIIDGLWRGEPFRFEGEHYKVDEVTFLPRPVQRPRIPIWVGGGYPLPGPTSRALRWDGSKLYKAHVAGRDGKKVDPGPMTADDVRRLRAMATDRPFDIAVGGSPRTDDIEADRSHIRAVDQAGATWWVEWIPPGERDAMRAAVDRGPLRAALSVEGVDDRGAPVRRAGGRVAFVCEHGALRSRIAAAYFTAWAPVGWAAVSAGVNPQRESSTRLGEVMAGTVAEEFVDRARPRSIADVPMSEARVIAIDTLVPGAESWITDTSSEQGDAALRDEISLLVRALVDEIAATRSGQPD